MSLSNRLHSAVDKTLVIADVSRVARIGGPNGHVLVKSAPWVAVTWYLVYRCFFLVGALTLRSGQVFRIRLSPF